MMGRLPGGVLPGAVLRGLAGFPHFSWLRGAPLLAGWNAAARARVRPGKGASGPGAAGGERALAFAARASYLPRAMRPALILLLPLGLVACGPRYSPDAYATRAVQQMASVEQGVVIGRRQVLIQAEGSTGAAAGGAAGGIIGSQTPGGNMAGAIGAVGGALLGGLLGTAAERVAGDTTAYEYIVRKTDGQMVSVTQRDPQPLEVGLRVLVIAGPQARIVADYTEPGQAAPREIPLPPEPQAVTAPPPAIPAPADPPPAAPPADPPAGSAPG